MILVIGMKEELHLYGNEYSLFDTFYNGKSL